MKKLALFGFKKKPAPKETPITKEHEKALLPSFKKHDALRKKGDYDHPDNMHFVHAVSDLEAKTGIPNERLYAHMYKHHGYNRHEKTASFWDGFHKQAGFTFGAYARNLAKETAQKAAPMANRAATTATTAVKKTMPQATFQNVAKRARNYVEY